MPLRPIMQKNLTIRSHQTGTKADIEEAMQLSASGKVRCEFDVMSLLELNEALDKIKKGEVLGKIVLDVDAASAGR
jgi:propanol-preferring alcohol dehydrogenase